MKRILIFLSVALLLSSCNSLIRYGDRRVAAIGRDVLFESDVQKLLPENISPQDSAAMVRKYVDTWALSKLLLLKAEAELSKSDRDIEKQIEDYRRNLLGFRYEKSYIESRLDTLVNDKEIEEYFNTHQANYMFPYSIVKARVARISTKSPYYEMIKGGFKAESASDVLALEELCMSSAERYVDFGKAWTGVGALARELGMGVSECETAVATQRFFEIENESGSYIVYVLDRVAPNEVSPLDYNRENIKESIISRRKQNLLVQLEQDLLEEAVSKKKLKIYNYDE